MPKSTFHNLPSTKRQRIIDLAIDEFSTHPYRQASLSRIVSRAGIAKGSMYQYFANKYDLYHWLVTEELPRRRQTWFEGRTLTGAGGLFAELEQRAIAEIGFFLASPRQAKLAASALEPTGDPELRELHGQLRAVELGRLTLRVRQAQAEGELRRDLDVDTLVLLIEAVLTRAAPRAVLARLGVDVHGLLADPGRGTGLREAEWRELVHQSLNMLSRGVTAEPPPRVSEADTRLDAGLDFDDLPAIPSPVIEWRPRDEAIALES